MTHPKKKDEWTTALEWGQAGKKIALASVIATWGSSPRPVGSLLVIRADGLFEGSVSGGCVEGAVVTEALDILKNGQPKVMDFGISNASAWEVGLACGGKISILVAAVAKRNIALLEALNQARRARAAVVLATRFGDGAMALYHGGAWQGADDQPFWNAFSAAAEAALAADTPGVAGDQKTGVFLNVVSPRPRMFVIGAVHVAQSLIPVAAMAGYDVTLVDPRGAFAEASRFPDANIIEDWPDAVLQAAGLDARSAVVTLAHDPKLDDAALAVALKSPCFYIGALGSRKTHASRLERLREAGFSAAEVARINGPVGLAIGAKTPAEIAISILAQVTEARRKPGK